MGCNLLYIFLIIISIFTVTSYIPSKGIPSSHDTLCSYVSTCTFKEIKNTTRQDNAGEVEICKTACEKQLPVLTDPSQPLGIKVAITTFMYIPIDPVQFAAYPSFNVSLTVMDKEIGKVKYHLRQIGGGTYNLCYEHTFKPHSPRPVFAYVDCFICLEYDPGVSDYILAVESSGPRRVAASYQVHVPYKRMGRVAWMEMKHQACSWKPTLAVNLAPLQRGQVQVLLDGPDDEEGIDVTFSLLRGRSHIHLITLPVRAPSNNFTVRDVAAGQYQLHASSSCFNLTSRHFTVSYPSADVSFLVPLIICFVLVLLGISLVFSFRRVFFTFGGADKKVALLYDNDNESISQKNLAFRHLPQFGVELLLFQDQVHLLANKVHNLSPTGIIREFLNNKAIDAYVILYSPQSSLKIKNKINNTVDNFSIAFRRLCDLNNLRGRVFVLYFGVEPPPRQVLGCNISVPCYKIPEDVLRFAAHLRGDSFYWAKPRIRAWEDCRPNIACFKTKNSII